MKTDFFIINYAQLHTHTHTGGDFRQGADNSPNFRTTACEIKYLSWVENLFKFP